MDWKMLKIKNIKQKIEGEGLEKLIIYNIKPKKPTFEKFVCPDN